VGILGKNPQTINLTKEILMEFDDFFGQEEFMIDPDDLDDLPANTSENWDTGLSPDIFSSGESPDIFTTRT
jgi:hypothetical protein